MASGARRGSRMGNSCWRRRSCTSCYQRFRQTCSALIGDTTRGFATAPACASSAFPSSPTIIAGFSQRSRLAQNSLYFPRPRLAQCSRMAPLGHLEIPSERSTSAGPRTRVYGPVTLSFSTCPRTRHRPRANPSRQWASSSRSPTSHRPRSS
jgi:hypothetical protein